jgi:protein-arginine kinase
LNRDWPSGRGIFHNNDKTFLTWVNEEDQLRIISMQNGSNIRQVFERLSVASAKIEAIAKFANDDHLVTHGGGASHGAQQRAGADES